jgi:hypothetical protein
MSSSCPDSGDQLRFEGETLGHAKFIGGESWAFLEMVRQFHFERSRCSLVEHSEEKTSGEYSCQSLAHSRSLGAVALFCALSKYFSRINFDQFLEDGRTFSNRRIGPLLCPQPRLDLRSPRPDRRSWVKTKHGERASFWRHSARGARVLNREALG